MKPYYDKDGITIYCGDCRDVLPTLPKCDLLLTDPPYGIGWNPRVNHKDTPWRDNERFDPTSWMSVGIKRVFWGANYFCDKLPTSGAWLTWVKRPIDKGRFSKDDRSYATTELAWSNFGKNRFKCLTWDGSMRQGEPENRSFCHPSQKPVELMRWCIPDDAELVLDPFMGSGTTLVAAKLLGRRAIGIEIEERYCEIAVNRLRQGVLTFLE